jgi:hypothetical protein
MTGLPESNYPAFNAAAALWRAAGWEVDNPAEHFGGDQTRSYADYVECDLAALKSCDAIALLPGWNGPTARGSVWEHFVARDLLDLIVYEDATQPQPPPYAEMPPSIGAFMDAVLGVPFPLTRGRDGALGRYAALEGD